MSPQKPAFNRKIWGELELRVRELNANPKIFETYVICGPIFDFDKAVESIGNEDSNEVTIPIPHAYFKSILVETNTGDLKMWSFVLPNEEAKKPLDRYLVRTRYVERFAGIKLWERLVGTKIEQEKERVRKIWK